MDINPTIETLTEVVIDLMCRVAALESALIHAEVIDREAHEKVVAIVKSKADQELSARKDQVKEEIKEKYGLDVDEADRSLSLLNRMLGMDE